MVIAVADAGSTTRYVKTTETATQHVPHHIVDTLTCGTVAVTGLVSVGGTVAISTISGTVFVGVSGPAVVSGGGGFFLTSGSGGFISVSGGGGFILASGSGGFISATGITGNVAHDAADSGNPVKVGGVALTTHSITPVISGDRVNFIADKYGSQIFTAWPVDLITATGRLITVTGETVIVVATASEFHDIMYMEVTHNGTSGVLVQIRDVTASGALHQIYLAAKGGIVRSPGIMPLVQGTATAWTAAITTSDVSYAVNIQYRRRI